MKCLHCEKEFNNERKTAKYCSFKCRKLAFLNKSDSVPKNDKVSVPEVSVPDIPPKIDTMEKQSPFSIKVGTGICHGCGRKIIDIQNQWVDGKGSEENAKLICICIDCIKKGITHQGLGLDIKNCEL